MGRRLATIRRIDDINPIKKADKIEVATVGGWKAVIGKNQFRIGENVIYCEIDSFLPIREEFEFLRPSSYLELEDGTEGFRLRTVKLRGQVSQGLILSMNLLNDWDIPVGTDVTERLGITKYEKPIPKELEDMAHGYIPNQVHKTDEERIQNLTEDYTEYKKYSYNASEKLDGESFTSFIMKDKYSVCTRQLDLIVPDTYEDSLPHHLRYALKNNLEEKIRSLKLDVALQGELIGPGITKNKYGLPELDLYLFNIFDINTYSYMPKDEAYDIAKQLGIKTVPIIEPKLYLPDTVDGLLKIAEGKSALLDTTEREGLVLVANNSPERVSFKIISNKFLLKGGE